MSESRWIAFELHDGLMQWVIGARMHIAAMVASLKKNPESDDASDELASKLTQILSYLNQASEEGRQLIRFLEGLPCADGSVDVVETLATTVDVLGRKTQQGRPALNFCRPEQPWPALPPQFAWTIVRIVQQAAVNAVRHSGAERINLVLGTSPDGQFKVDITDDGRGFDPGAAYPGHYGLSSMRQRAAEAHIDLAIDSRPGGGGSRVSLRFSVPPDGA